MVSVRRASGVMTWILHCDNTSEVWHTQDELVAKLQGTNGLSGRR